MPPVTQQETPFKTPKSPANRGFLGLGESLRFVAESEGFEPSIGVNLYALSRGAPSATRPTLRNSGCARKRRRIIAQASRLAHRLALNIGCALHTELAVLICNPQSGIAIGVWFGAVHTEPLVPENRP